MGHVPSELYGISVNEIARICGVDLSTARRWKRGAICPPKTALVFLSADLGAFDPQWRGWCLRHGCLISPEGWEISRNDVLSAPLLRAQLSAYQAALREAHEQHALDEQPEPGILPAIYVGTNVA